MANNVHKCLICGVRPTVVGRPCQHCQQQIEADKARRKAPKPDMYLTYKGHTVGLYSNGDGTFRGELVTTNGIPKTKVIDLNTYLPGYTREQIKRLKAGVMAVADIRVKRVKVTDEPKRPPKRQVSTRR